MSRRKVQPGQKLQIPAEAYNAWQDAVRAERDRQHDVAQDAATDARQTSVVKVKNMAETDSFNAMAIRGMGVDSLAQRTAKATEAVAKNTDELVRRAEDGGLAFA